ncbi:hypothetical protein GP486_002470 [Trichoglossum hirsutum]|uniref:Uncharacterized protein n=1 Tax=Trichoglossum hirsutum TaxID=265104 RepID=A0A9P8RRM8_9PEZI|nr:hypothetical protein GP486_002470 [Trichoglossum hirsutum]
MATPTTSFTDTSSRAASSRPSSPPSDVHSNERQRESESRADVILSEAMLREDMLMKAARKEEDNKYRKKYEEEREQDIKNGEMDIKFQRLQYLIGQSKIYANIMMAKMEAQQAAMRSGEQEQEKKRESQQEEKANKAATIPQRKSARASAATEGSNPESGKNPLRPVSKKATVKKRDGLRISDYFKKEDLEAKAGKESVAEALEEAALEQEHNPKAVGAQVLRSARQPILITGGVMRNYQLEGLDWLCSLYENGLNGILADEMGLGKTIQTIAFLAFLREKGVMSPFLIAAPLSTLSNWVDEFERFAPGIPVVLYHGTPAQRAEIRHKRLRKESSPDFPVICTTYEICMNDRKYLADYNWKFIIIVGGPDVQLDMAVETKDEGHRIKNLNCRLIKELKSYKSANRLLITGTPLQNNLAELWSLLNFLMPEIFDALEAFESWFDFSALQEKDGHRQILNGERKSNLISSLHAILKPFLLRRTKGEVETSLPKKREYILYAPLSSTQKELYKEILEGNSRNYLEQKVIERITSSGASTPSSTKKRKAASGISTPNKSNRSSRTSTPAGSVRGRNAAKRRSYKELNDDEFFRQLDESDSEDAVEEEDEVEVERARTIALAKREIMNKKLQNPVMQLRLACNSPHNFYWPWERDEVPDSRIISESGKMRLLDFLVPALFARDHKILIFSQFKTQLDILEDWATLVRGWRVCRIDGQVKQEDRREQIKAFNADPEHKMFLLSTRAGGQGINLAAADTVILFDSDWNPQQDLQAQDRAHRIGQTKPVIVYRLATKGTVEQTLLEKADGKRKLEKLVIQKGKFKSLILPNNDDIEELRRILIENDFEKYEAGEGAEILSEGDLDVLMDRSDEAYRRAEEGLDSGKDFKVVETKREGEGILAAVGSK